MNKITLIVVLGLILILACSNEEKNEMAEKKDIVVVAHRGASGYAPENTLSAMRKAIELNADMSELDVQETADGEIILLHDVNLKRTSGVDRNIWEVNSHELRDVEVGKWLSDEYEGEHVPTLVEVIDLVRGKMKLNIELKTNGHEKLLAERALKIVEEKDFLDEVVFTSFKFDEVRRIRNLNKKTKVGYIFSKIPDDVDVFTEDIDLLSAHYKLVDEEFVHKARAGRKKIAVWTVNEPKDMRRMIQLGVDQIITNYPDVLRKLLN